MTAIFLFTVVLMSLSIHEFAHAYSASLMGDTTAKEQGRMTINPLKHIDPFGTIILPLILVYGSAVTGGLVPVFGYAKPVPVAHQRMRNPKSGLAIVAAAGPLSNFLIALVAAFFINPIQWMQTPWITFIFSINVLLASFNLIPIPPLDGSRIVSAMLPEEWSVRYNQMGIVGFIFLLIFIQSDWLNFIFIESCKAILKLVHA